MNKTIIYALLQTIKRFLFSIFKHRIPIEKYLFQNCLSIQTFWQIGLHRAVPLRTFSRGHSVDVSVQSLKQLCSKLPQWDSSGSGLISVIHAFWVSEREMLALIAAFRQLIACSTMFGKGLWGGSILSSVFGAGMTGFRWAGAPSYTKITSSSGSRFVLACARKLSKRAALILLRAAEENTSPLIGEIAIVIVKFRPRRILDGTPSLPAALYRGFWPSKCCNRIRRQTHSGALRHGS